MANYWLMKSEPGEFSIDDLAARPSKTEPWDGVRNYQARNMMRDEMRPGDKAFFYHSACDEPGIVGIVKVAGKAYPDPTAFDPEDKHFDPKSDPDDPRWFLVDVQAERAFPEPVPLPRLRETASLASMPLLQAKFLSGKVRSSVSPVGATSYSV